MADGDSGTDPAHQRGVACGYLFGFVALIIAHVFPPMTVVAAPVTSPVNVTVPYLRSTAQATSGNTQQARDMLLNN